MAGGIQQNYVKVRLTAFVTGANGFLGTNLVKELSAQNWDVTAFCLPHTSIEYLADLPVKIELGDIELVDNLKKAMPEKVDAVFHLAANTSLWSRNNQQQYHTNVIGTKNVIDVALQKQVGKFIHTSSISSYGFHLNTVYEHTVSTAMNSKINYFITKLQAEQLVKATTSHGLHTVILNPAHIMGPFDLKNWVQVFTNVSTGQMPGIPDNCGNFVYAPEVAKAHIAAYHKGQNGQNYILGGEQTTMLEFVNLIEEYLDKPISRRAIPMWMLWAACKYYQLKNTFSGKEPILTPEKVRLLSHPMICDDSKARQELQFKTVPLQTMVASTCQWLKEEKIIE